MTVAELIEHLKQYPSDMLVCNERFSDVQVISPEDWRVEQGFQQQGERKNGWVSLLSHAWRKTARPDVQSRVKDYLVLAGN